jgi:hypothetical protein
MHDSNRKDNAVVLSEALDENAMQTLLDLSIAGKSPEKCNEWHAAKKDSSDFYSRERTKREHTVFEELASKEHEMQRALRGAVVEDVMALFPCVLYVKVPSHRMLRSGSW